MKDTIRFTPSEGEPVETVQIIRRQIVGEVILTETGKRNPVEALFSQAGEYLAEHDDSEGVNLEFTLWGRTFSASIGPEPVKDNDTREAY